MKIAIKNITPLSFEYNQKEDSIWGFNNTLESPGVYKVIASSGSGKSTLLRAINLLEEISDGQIFLNDEDISDPRVDQDQIRRQIGLVFQAYNWVHGVYVGATIGSEMIAESVMRGFRDPNGSWKIIWISARSGRSSRRESGARSTVEPSRRR